ncbi:unnamed protein product [Vitrella brassicaformis CCMP3155]|uniref:RNA helicase n=2 Tax=Vitrella brassicaformis TaxID=1169539 RepID=A0A0G4FF55_VITBC|nr:unnamed protein product [Vitrella brassicaformis CCMP3155]|eukprot:CEM11820.1 unnamed protein product [Vitrella brassicaformis CCMP3155]
MDSDDDMLSLDESAPPEQHAASDESRGKKKRKGGGFQSMDLSAGVLKGVLRMGYKVPTPIQRKCIPPILEGVDVVAMARTGSGKTAAYLIPILQKLQAHSVVVGVRCVILSPTRELAIQTSKFAKQLGRFTDLRLCMLIGGGSMERQFERLSNNPDIIVATPGRLMHHLVETDLRLTRVQVLVFDEADRLFELGFSDQLREILSKVPSTRQCLLVSATLPSQLVEFSKARLREPVFVRLDVENTLSDQLKLTFLYLRSEEKLACVLFLFRQVIKAPDKAILFAATRHHTEFLGALLRKVGVSCSIVYGTMDQTAREQQLAHFRKGVTRVLVVTDVAARGLDIPFLEYVVNFDFPTSPKLFVHRAGRTARAGRSGSAISLVTSPDLPYTMELLLFLGRKLRVAGHGHEDPQHTDTQQQDDSDNSCVYLGGVPHLEDDTEWIRAQIGGGKKGEEASAAGGDSELKRLYGAMDGAYKLYYKTRPSASKASVKRTKELIQQVGGVAKLGSTPHPDFGTQFSETEAARAHFIDDLRRFRPRAEDNKGRVLSPEILQRMQQHRDIHTLQHYSTKRQEEDEQDELDQSDDQDEGDSAPATMAQRSHQTTTPSPTPAHPPRPRMSKRRRNKLAKMGGQAENGQQDLEAMEEEGITVAVGAYGDTKAHQLQQEHEVDQDGANVFERTTKRDPTFYLSATMDARNEAKERGLQLDAHRLDLVPDESTDMKKSKQVMKWNARKKKYMLTDVDASGRALKRKNEAGVTVKGDRDVEGTYKKWARETNRRIQAVGEQEEKQEHTHTGRKRPRDDESETDEDGDEPTEPPTQVQRTAGGKRDAGLREAVEKGFTLTHKQQRKAKKIGLLPGGKQPQPHAAKDADATQLKTAKEIAKAKREQQRMKVRTTPKLRQKAAKRAKDAWMSKQRDKAAMKGAPNRSMLIVRQGGKKGFKGLGRGGGKGTMGKKGARGKK